MGDFTLWIKFGLSPKFGLSERLIQKVKSRSVMVSSWSWDFCPLNLNSINHWWYRNNDYVACVGTMVYCCPEWLELGRYHAEPATVWSLGCLLYDMVFGNVPFLNRQQIIGAKPTFSAPVSPGKRCSGFLFKLEFYEVVEYVVAKFLSILTTIVTLN